MRPEITYYLNPDATGWAAWIDYPDDTVRFVGLDGHISQAYQALY